MPKIADKPEGEHEAHRAREPAIACVGTSRSIQSGWYPFVGSSDRSSIRIHARAFRATSR